MKLTFLGSGGGRVVLMTQLRATGGFVIEMDGKTVHVDPGPGALVRANQYKVNLRKLDGIIVTHTHTDHCIDVDPIIEAMTSGGHNRKGFLLGNGLVFKGGGNYRQSVSPFHLNLLEKHRVMKPGETFKSGSIQIKATKTVHDDVHAFGFVMKGSETFGYTSDTEYFEGLAEQFEGCDYLLLNVLEPRGKSWKGHMNSEDVAKVLDVVKPKKAFISHLGMLMLKANPEKEARWIEKQTGIETVAARDGMVFDSGFKGLAAFNRI